MCETQPTEVGWDWLLSLFLFRTLGFFAFWFLLQFFLIFNGK